MDFMDEEDIVIIFNHDISIKNHNYTNFLIRKIVLKEIEFKLKEIIKVRQINIYSKIV
jgi:hypothetical protein